MDRQVSVSAIVTIPNAISLARLLAVPVAVWLAVIGAIRTDFFLFVAAGLSDALDGVLARRGAHTRLGAVLDPLADKLLLVSMSIVLAAIGRLPDWLAILVVFRDLLIVGGVLVLQFIGDFVSIAPLRVSKANTAALVGLIAATLFQAGFGVSFPRISGGLIGLVAATTVLSGAAYLWRGARGRHG